VDVGYIRRTKTSADAATNESKDLLSVVEESAQGIGWIHEFCDGNCAEDITQ